MTDCERRGHRTSESTPDPDDPAQARRPTDMTSGRGCTSLRKTVHEFTEDQCTDLAAALTYYAVLAMFPALLALISLLGVVGQGDKAVDTVLETLGPLVSRADVEPHRAVARELASSQAAGLALIIGLAGALWSASGYTGAFGRAMNRIYEIEEGRPFWKLRPIMLVLTWSLSCSGPRFADVGRLRPAGRVDRRRRGSRRRRADVWKIAKWPVLRAGRDPDRRAALLHDPQRQAAEVPLALGRCRRRHPHLGARLGGVRVLRRELLQLQQDLRLTRRRHRRAAVPVDHQPGAAVRGRARRRARARPPAAGGHRRRGGAPAPRARHPEHQEGPQEARTRTSPSDVRSVIRRRRPVPTTTGRRTRRRRNDESSRSSPCSSPAGSATCSAPGPGASATSR